ncbi:DUF255 domain-containing protein [Flaviaesturariibacter aridisoli]|uniref:DUF255 domain-containing protein n=2 Tax=Flaviaesturariibacter aridisoli TaxID=2545761 RepID=A0A4R4DYU2_9BACT|nr:DUF255 domain-containing protein [Flaviaesturariibacter aridisoli]
MEWYTANKFLFLTCCSNQLHMKRLLLLLCGMPLLSMAQQKGIQFIHAANWQAVLRQAKAENKLIFVDAYTTWCGPCRYLSSEIFPKEEVGALYNQRFISVKMQLDTTAQDNEYVRQWYPDAGRMMRDMNINVFPTLLFFDADGKPIHRVAGAGDAERVLGYARTALDTSKRYYGLKARYESGHHDEQTLRDFLRSAVMAYDYPAGSKALQDLLRVPNFRLEKETAELVEVLTRSTNDEAFRIVEADPARFDSLVGRKGAAQQFVRDVITYEMMDASVRTRMGPEFAQETARLRTRFGAVADELAARAAMLYYRSAADWDRFATAAIAYFKLAGNNVSAGMQNEIAWSFFEHITDKAMLNEALAISKASLSVNEPNYIDTYANLLHKLGRTQEAIEWETKAMAMVSEDQKGSYRNNIDKFKKGEKTW